MFAGGRGSLSQMIQHSDDLRRIFKNFIKESASSAVVTSQVDNLRAAKHRFESLQKPMGRSCLFLGPMIKTALHVVASRTDKSRDRAGQWLQYIDDENCLALAMLADAADEAMLLTRLLDNEDVDPAAANDEVQLFVNKVHGLFGDSRGCLRVTGYTSTMLRFLEQPIVFTVRSQTCSIGRHGGVLASQIDRCLGRMRCWMVLAKATLSAEFPDFDFLTSLSVFNLRKEANHDGEEAKKNLDRVACALSLDAGALKAQYDDVLPRACQIAKAEQLSNKDGWATTLSRLHSRPMIAKAHPTAELKNALVAYTAFGASTSGVEQAFSKGAWAFSNRQLKAHPNTEEMVLKLTIDMPSNNVDKVVAGARRVWAHCYGPPRESKVTRVDKGTKRCRSVELEGVCPNKRHSSEVAFLRARRRATQDASVPGGSIHDILESDSLELHPEWNDQLTKELDFQKDKLQKRLWQASFEKQLLPSEDSAAIRFEHGLVHETRVKDQRARERKEDRDDQKTRGTLAKDMLLHIKGSSVFIDATAASHQLGLALGCHSLKQATCHSMADVFVVNDVVELGDRIKWASVLRGATVVTPGLIIDRKGVALQMKAATTIGRIVFVSAACHDQHKGLFKFIRLVVGATPSSKWQWIWGDVAEFLRLKAKHIKTPTRVIGVVKAAEKTQPEFAGIKHMFTVIEFFSFSREVKDCVTGL